VVEEVCCAIKGDFPQIKREDDNANIIFTRRGSGYSGVPTKYDLCKTIGDINACTDFEMLEVKVTSVPTWRKTHRA
jgi:hypothetical protein